MLLPGNVVECYVHEAVAIIAFGQPIHRLDNAKGVLYHVQAAVQLLLDRHSLVRAAVDTNAEKKVKSVYKRN